MKRMRQEAILAILEERRVSSQSQLVKELARRGFRVTQATVSRDLLELKVARVREEGGDVRYVREVGRKVADEYLRKEELARVLRSYMLSVECSGNLLVLRTDPGNAQPLALGLDRARLRELLGTVAGDDTVICVVREGTDASRVARDLRRLAEGRIEPPSAVERKGERKESK